MLGDTQTVCKLIEVLGGFYRKSEYTADVYTYLDPDLQEDIVTALTSDQLAKVISYVYSDDIVDSIQELPANLTSKIIAATPASKRAEINQLLSYKEDSTGSIMSTEYIMLKETDTAETAIKTIRREAEKRRKRS